MTDREAMKMALEALEGIHVGNMTPMAEENWNKALTALRQALAQPDKPLRLSPVYEYGHIHDASQPEQEPVDIHCPSCLHSFSIVPVAKREWVGLHLDDMPETYAGDKSFLNIAKWAEAKLKEKNGG